MMVAAAASRLAAVIPMGLTVDDRDSTLAVGVGAKF